MKYPKVNLKSSIDVKPWWHGDKRVEPFMPKVTAELDKTGLPTGTKTSIYNRCYEAVYEAIRKYADGRQEKGGRQNQHTTGDKSEPADITPKCPNSLCHNWSHSGCTRRNGCEWVSLCDICERFDNRTYCDTCDNGSNYK